MEPRDSYVLGNCSHQVSVSLSPSCRPAPALLLPFLTSVSDSFQGEPGPRGDAGEKNHWVSRSPVPASPPLPCLFLVSSDLSLLPSALRCLLLPLPASPCLPESPCPPLPPRVVVVKERILSPVDPGMEDVLVTHYRNPAPTPFPSTPC